MIVEMIFSKSSSRRSASGYHPCSALTGSSPPLTSGLPRLADILRVIRHVSKVPTAKMHDRGQDAETVLAALRMTSRTTLGFDSMGT